MQDLKQLLSNQWIMRNGSIDQRMVEFCMKESTYLNMGDYWLQLSSKPKIDRAIYYADQVPGTFEMAEDPGTDWETFKRYNMRMNSQQDLIDHISSDSNKLYIVNQYTNDRTGGLIKTFTTRPWNDECVNGRRATYEEKAIIINELKNELIKYEERLARYYKRYGNKVYTVSYWADR